MGVCCCQQTGSALFSTELWTIKAMAQPRMVNTNHGNILFVSSHSTTTQTLPMIANAACE